MKLRCYQKEIAKSQWNYLHDEDGDGVVISPTGTGKSLCLNHLCKKFTRQYDNTKVMVVTHDKKIVGQNAQSMIDYWGKADVGIYSAGLNKRDTDNRIIYANVQSIAKRVEEFGEVHLLIIDECHLLSPNDGTMYRKLIEGLRETYPKLRIIGYSATPYRLGQGHLVHGDNAMFNDVIIDFSSTDKFNWFVDEGYLVPLVTKDVEQRVDVTALSIQGGDFKMADVQEMCNTTPINVAVVEECIKYGQSRKHWMVFASGVEHGFALEELFNSYGVSAVMIHAGTTDKNQKQADWEDGKYKVLINVGMFTTGYDFKPLDLICVARATQSTALWVQILGRGTRPLYYCESYPLTKDERLAGIAASQKQSTLVLDFAGNTERLGPINCPIVPRPRRKGQVVETEAPVKTCPDCRTFNHTRAPKCISCGYEFPPPDTLEMTASTAAVMARKSMEAISQDFEILSVIYKQGQSPRTGNKYLQIIHTTLGRSFSEFLLVENHDDRFQMKKLEMVWWHRLRDKAGFHKHGYPYPSTVEEAAERAPEELRDPDVLTVDVNVKHGKILGCSFDTKVEEDPDEVPF